VIHRLFVLALGVSLVGTVVVTPPAARAASPWTITPSTDRVAASFTSATSGTDVTVALRNQTSIPDVLGLGADDALVLQAFGLTQYSQAAIWMPGSGLTVDCLALANPACFSFPNGTGGVMIPGSAAAALVVRAPTGAGQAVLAVRTSLETVALDVTFVVIGIALQKLGVGGAAVDAIVSLALRLRPSAAIVVDNLLRRDLVAASASLNALVSEAWTTILEEAVAFGLGAALASKPAIWTKVAAIGIAIAKVALPLAHHVAAALGKASTTVTVAYSGAPPLVLSGTWVSPKAGATVKTLKLTLSSKPTASLSEVKITKVVYSIAWGSKAPKTACAATKAAKDGTWSCSADLVKLTAPLGKLTLSFDVFDDAGDVSHAPDGTRIVTFAPPPAAPSKVVSYQQDLDCDAVGCFFPVRLTWQDNADNELAYKVYATPLGPDGQCGLIPEGSRRLVATIKANSTSWQSKVREGEWGYDYFAVLYAVAATNSSGSSAIIAGQPTLFWANCNIVSPG
jgi:hypothetical protein